MKRSEEDLIREALQHIEEIRYHEAQEHVPSRTIRDAINMRLSALIAVIHRGGPEFYNRLFGEDWHRMWATRNIIAHDYSFVDAEIIRLTVAKRLPEVERILEDELARLTGNPGHQP